MKLSDTEKENILPKMAKPHLNIFIQVDEDHVKERNKKGCT